MEWSFWFCRYRETWCESCGNEYTITSSNRVEACCILVIYTPFLEAGYFYPENVKILFFGLTKLKCSCVLKKDILLYFASQFFSVRTYKHLALYTVHFSLVYNSCSYCCNSVLLMWTIVSNILADFHIIYTFIHVFFRLSTVTLGGCHRQLNINKPIW